MKCEVYVITCILINLWLALLPFSLFIVAVLKYHVIQATAYSAGLSSGAVQTLQGGTVNITVSTGKSYSFMR